MVVGLNDTPDREPDQCAFNDEIFLIYSSVISFYIPCIFIVILYYKIFKVIRLRAQVKMNASKIRYGASDKKGDKKAHVNSSKNEVLVEKKSKKKAKTELESQKINLISPGIFKLKNRAAQITQLHNQGSSFDQNLTTPLVNNISNTNISSPNGLNIKNSNGDNLMQEKSVTSKIKPVNKANSNDSKSNILVKTNSINSKKFVRAKTVINTFKTNPSLIASNKERKVTKTLAIVVIVFLVCW